MILRELIYKIKEPYDGGIGRYDSALRPRRIYSAIKSARARVLADAIKQKGKISDFNFTTLPCVPLTKVTAYECGCIPQIGCKYYKTECELPASDEQNPIKYVTSLDGSIVYSPIAWDRVNYKNHDKYTSLDPYYFIRNNHLYLIDTQDRSAVTIVGLFDDPIGVRDSCGYCPDDDSGACTSYLDMDFPIDQRYVFRLIQLVRYEIAANFAESGRSTLPQTEAQD